MPAGTIASHRDAAANHQLRARELNLKAEIKEISAILKVNPQAATGVLKHLHDIGLNSEVAACRASPQSKFAAAVARRSDTRKAAADTPHPTMQTLELSTYKASELVPAKVWTLGSFSVNDLSAKILPHIEPSSMSKANLRSIKSTPDCTMRMHMTRLLVRATGLPEDYEVQGEERIWERLLSKLQSLNEERGRPLRDVSLPVDWAAFGAFEAQLRGPDVLVKFRATGVVAAFPGATLPPGLVLTNLEIKYNWSDSLAALVDKTGCSEFQPTVLMPLFGAKPEAPCGLMMSQRALAIADVVHSPAGSSLTELCDGFASPSSRGSATPRDRSRSRARSLRSLSAGTRSPSVLV